MQGLSLLSLLPQVMAEVDWTGESKGDSAIDAIDEAAAMCCELAKSKDFGQLEAVYGEQ